MKNSLPLIDELSVHEQWRHRVGEQVLRLKNWLNANDVGGAQLNRRLQNALDRLGEDNLTVAFIAEFSRGKSELINAIFFSNYDDRILPSSTGRTTMCPTELKWSPDDDPEIRLLPITSRTLSATVADLKKESGMWTSVPLQIESLRQLQEAFARVSETMRVTARNAERLGFEVDPNGEHGLKPDEEGFVEIPSWRHAIIQFPHPLLRQGLVVLDTPGLNAIGAEPELTLSLLPNAHAVLFILSVDTGVTQSDLAVWRDYIQSGMSRTKGRMVVLNKIDGLWDGLRDKARIEHEIKRQTVSVADTFGIAVESVFPVSAQKGLVARIAGDQALLERSRLPELEAALANDLLDAKHDIVKESTLSETEDVSRQVLQLLSARLEGVREQARELGELRGKNQNVIEYMMRKIKNEKKEFETGLARYSAIRTIFPRLTNELLDCLGLERLKEETLGVRKAMDDALFAKRFRGAMEEFFIQLHQNLTQGGHKVTEILDLVETMRKRFAVEHSLKLEQPEPFSLAPYDRQIHRLEQAVARQFETASIILTSTRKKVWIERFFNTTVREARHIFEAASQHAEQWLRAIMHPLETQIRERQIQLKRRLENIRHVHQSTTTLDERLEVLAHQGKDLEQLQSQLDQYRQNVTRALENRELRPIGSSSRKKGGKAVSVSSTDIFPDILSWDGEQSIELSLSTPPGSKLS